MLTFPLEAGWTAPLARALVTLEVGSAFCTGQKPPLCFFLNGAGPSPLVECVESPLEVTVVDEELEVLEESDDDDELLVTTFLCGMNMRETSSELIAGKPPWFPVGPSHPSLWCD